MYIDVGNKKCVKININNYVLYMSGIYVHIPFCRHKCIYCDFYSVGARRAPWERLAAAIVREARLRSAEVCGSVRTLYIGGGTP